MPGPRHPSNASSASGKAWTIPLTYAVTAPFVLLLLLAVGLTGYLSSQSGRQSVNDMTLRLQDEILAHIDRALRGFLSMPRLINQANRNAVELGMLDPLDLPAWKDHLLRQAGIHTYAGNIAAGNESRQYLGIDLRDGGQTVVQFSDASTGFALHTYAVDESGQLNELIHVSKDYDPTTRPWYRTPAEARRPGWSDIYKHFIDPTLQIALSEPLWDAAGNLVGVTTAALRLSRIAEFLESLDVGEHGRIFIMEPSRLLVASSAHPPFHHRPDGSIERINALDGDGNLPQAALAALERYPDGLAAINGPIMVRYTDQGRYHFLKIAPLRDEFGLNWLVAVDLSEDDFMGQINENFLKTLLLIALTLLVSAFLGVLVNRRAVRPLLELDKAARQIAGGGLDSRVDESRSDEIGSLAHSFNIMADRVQESMQALEQRVEELHQAQAEHEKLQAQLNQAQKMESLGILAGGVAHDFNNLLHAMRGNIELLSRDQSGDSLDARRLRTVTKSIDRATQLVQQLLLFSRKYESRREKVDVNLEVEEVFRMLERTIPKMIALELRLDPQAWPLFADPVQLEQILLNLTGNSVDAMPQGGRLILETGNVSLDADFVRLHPSANTGPHVLLTVSDTGCGMDEATLKHVFDPFFTTKEVGKGTGLGLASVYGIVKAHGGYIQCYSEPGQGTTFRVYLPAMEQGDATEVAPLPEPSLQGGHETILVVDDDPEILELNQEALEALGYAVQKAATGEEALAIYREQGDNIALVLLDLNMPGMGGHRCLQELLRLDPAVKVVIASGYTAGGHGKDLLSSGAMGFLGKPYQLKELAALVREVLDREKSR